MIFPPHNKDCALFEEKVNGKYLALHRPSSPELGGNYIWLAESPDRLYGATTVALQLPVLIVGTVPAWVQERHLFVQRKGGWKFIMVRTIKTVIVWELFYLI